MKRTSSELEKYSENISLSDIKGELKVVKIGKNDKIRKKVDTLLRFAQTKENVVLIGSQEGIQKLVTVAEIFKQKIKSNAGGKDNKQIAKIPEYQQTTVNGKVIEVEDTEFNQLNYLDYLLDSSEHRKRRKTDKQNSSGIETGEIEGVYSKNVLQEVLGSTKPVKRPVMYVFFQFHNNSQQLVRMQKSGWNLQQG